MNTKTWTLIGFGVLLAGLVVTSTGCGKSDAARMEEYRKKYAGAGVKDNDEEDEQAYVEEGPVYVAPSLLLLKCALQQQRRNQPALTWPDNSLTPRLRQKSR